MCLDLVLDFNGNLKNKTKNLSEKWKNIKLQFKMEELLEEIQNIQKYLYGGYKNESGSSNLDWLDVSLIKT